MSFNLGAEITEVKETLKKVRATSLIKSAKGKDGKMVHELLQLLELQLGMLAATGDKVKVAIEARDITIHHLGEQLMEIRHRDEKPVFFDSSSNAKKDPGLYRPDMEISDARRASMEEEMYMQMARLALGMGGAHTLGIDEGDLEGKIKEVAASMKNQAKQDSMVRKKVRGIIERGHKNNVPKEETTGFLMKKKVPINLINQCFSEFEESLSFDGSDEEDYSDEAMTPSVSCMGMKSPSVSKLVMYDSNTMPSLPKELSQKFSPRSATSPKELDRQLSSKVNFSL